MVSFLEGDGSDHHISRGAEESILYAFGESDFLAPKDSLLYAFANPMAIEAGGATSVITVIGYEAAGVLMKDRTIIHFTTNMGTIDPSAEVQGGRATAVFTSGPQSGEAEIYVTSGTVTAEPSPLKIAVGSSAMASLILQADSLALGPEGGTAHLTAVALDKNGNGLANIFVIFSTTAGTLDSGGNPVATNAHGRAEDTLKTTVNADVKAISGSVTSPVIKITIQENKPPAADFVFSPRDPRINEPVNLDGSISVDEDGTIVDYAWNFGNGDAGDGVQASTTYRSPGTYDVTLTVTDNRGAKNSKSKAITIAENELPVVIFNFSPVSPKTAETVYFNASESYDLDGAITRYKWDFGDGSEGTGIQVQHQFSAAGKYRVTLNVKDNNGGDKGDKR